jgi:hypothetical protein
MKYRLKFDNPLSSIDDLKKEINNGSKFIVFQYCVSLFFAVTLRRFSPAILIKENSLFNKYKRKYNIISYIFGWWGIPWGPIYTIKSININNNGAVDVTEEIMLNITEDSLMNNEVELLITNQFYTKPNKWDSKAFRRAFIEKFERDYKIKKIIVGLFINTEYDETHSYTIGIQVDKDYDKYVTLVREAAYTQFRKFTHFEFVNLTGNDDIPRLLEEQGEVVFDRKRV